MSSLPRIPPVPGQREGGSAFRESAITEAGHGHRRRTRPVAGCAKERITLPSIHGDRTSAMTSRDSRNPSPPILPPGKTAKLTTPTILHSPPKNRRSHPGGILALSSSPLKRCHLCGRDFDSASIDAHESRCRGKLLHRQARAALQAKSPNSDEPPELVHVPHSKFDQCELPAVNRSWEPFSCSCRYCGQKYGQHSIALHERRCSTRPQQPSQFARPQILASQERKKIVRARETLVSRSLKDDLIILPRPQTRTLNHSLLVEGGHDIPTVETMTTDTKDHSVACDACGTSIPADRASVHRRVCRTKPSSKLTKRPISFPTQVTMSVNEAGASQDELSHKRTINKPPTVVCYICGREYGTKSISIHEPQCLRKWQIENSKLPVSERKPLPKKNKVSKVPSVLRVTSREDTVIVGLPSSACSARNLENFVESYCLQSYDEFERDLQPCNKCGRTFAPETMARHAGRCNAKPLKSKH